MKVFIVILALFSFIECNAQTVSKRGKEFIKNHEKLTLTVTKHRAVGYYHIINSDDPLWLRRKYYGYKITKSQAEQIFESDIKKIESFIKEVNKKVKLTQNEIDALASITYNIGITGVKKTKFYSELIKGRKHSAGKTLASTKIWMKGHVNRRKAESELFLY